jgi:hypothetical protein
MARVYRARASPRATSGESSSQSLRQIFSPTQPPQLSATIEPPAPVAVTHGDRKWRSFVMAAATGLSQAGVMLQLRPNCEHCDRDLPADTTEARICSFECTFCAPCATTRLDNTCPNCGGELVTRPRRPAAALARHPASTERVFRPPTAGSAPPSARDR